MKGNSVLLFVSAGLMLSGGTVLAGSTAWTLLNVSYYFWTTDLGVELCSGVLVIAGALLCLPTCWLATMVPCHAKTKSVLITMMALVISSMMMLSLGVSSAASLSRELRDTAALNASMTRAMAQVSFNPAVRSSFSAMQIELRCCGVNSYTDWYQYRRTLPASCCGRAWNGKLSDQCTVSVYSSGCLRPASLELRRYSNSLCILACAIIIILAVSLFGTAHSLVSEGPPEERCKPPPPRHVACLPQTYFQHPLILPSNTHVQP